MKTIFVQKLMIEGYKEKEHQPNLNVTINSETGITISNQNINWAYSCFIPLLDIRDDDATKLIIDTVRKLDAAIAPAKEEPKDDSI